MFLGCNGARDLKKLPTEAHIPLPGEKPKQTNQNIPAKLRQSALKALHSL